MLEKIEWRRAERTGWAQENKSRRSTLAQGRFNQAVRLISGEENFAGIIHSKGSKIHGSEMLIGKREINFADAIEVVKDCLAHRVERVLKRVAVMVGKRFKHCLTYAVPYGAKLHFAAFVKRVRVNQGGKNAIAILFERRVRIAKESFEGGFRCFQHDQIVEACANRGSFSSTNQPGRTFLV